MYRINTSAVLRDTKADDLVRKARLLDLKMRESAAFTEEDRSKMASLGKCFNDVLPHLDTYVRHALWTMDKNSVQASVLSGSLAFVKGIVYFHTNDQKQHLFHESCSSAALLRGSRHIFRLLTPALQHAAFEKTLRIDEAAQKWTAVWDAFDRAGMTAVDAEHNIPDFPSESNPAKGKKSALKPVFRII